MSVAEFEENELTVEELNYVIAGGSVRKKYFGDRALKKSVEQLFSNHGAG